jgi:hypothetical protein
VSFDRRKRVFSTGVDTGRKPPVTGTATDAALG